MYPGSIPSWSYDHFIPKSLALKAAGISSGGRATDPGLPALDKTGSLTGGFYLAAGLALVGFVLSLRPGDSGPKSMNA